MSGWRQIPAPRKARRGATAGGTVKALALLKKMGEDVSKWKPRGES